MTPEQVKSPERKSASPAVPLSVKMYSGEVVYIYAFDVAYEMTRQPIRELLGQPVAQFSMDASKRSPRHLFFYRPQMVRLPLMERIGPHGRSLFDRMRHRLRAARDTVCRDYGGGGMVRWRGRCARYRRKQSGEIDGSANAACSRSAVALSPPLVGRDPTGSVATNRAAPPLGPWRSPAASDLPAGC